MKEEEKNQKYREHRMVKWRQKRSERLRMMAGKEM
jgi:hypothetical protein